MLLRPKCPICRKGHIFCEQKFTVTRTLPVSLDGSPIESSPLETSTIGKKTNVIKCDTCNRRIPKDRALRSIERHVGSIENTKELQRRESL